MTKSIASSPDDPSKKYETKNDDELNKTDKVDKTGDNAGTPNTPPPNNRPIDPFDPSGLKLSQDFAVAAPVKKVLTTVPVRKPSNESFIRTHLDAGYRLETMVLELKDEKEIYLVERELWPGLAGEPTFSARLIVTTVNTLGVVSLWPIRLPSPDGRIDKWSRSALEAANAAMERWVRVASNMSLGAYEISVAVVDKTPVWPQQTFRELLRIAFRDHFIDTLDHPVLKRLRGEV